MSALTLSSAKSFSRRPMPEQTNHAGKNFDEAKGASAPFWEGDSPAVGAGAGFHHWDQQRP
jgi:hypothetical protein